MIALPAAIMEQNTFSEDGCITACKKTQATDSPKIGKNMILVLLEARLCAATERRPAGERATDTSQSLSDASSIACLLLAISRCYKQKQRRSTYPARPTSRTT